MVNTIRVAAERKRCGIPFIFEQPAPWTDCCSAYDLDEFQPLLQDTRVFWVSVSQCQWGSYSEKPTALLMFGLPPPGWAARTDVVPARPAIRVGGGVYIAQCVHTRCVWIYPNTGRTFRARHPTLLGRRVAQRLQDNENGKPLPLIVPKGEFVSKFAAAYPDEMNKWLCSNIAALHLAGGGPSGPNPGEVSATRLHAAGLAQAGGRRAGILMEHRIRPDPQPSVEALKASAVGGLRRCAASVAKLPLATEAGRVAGQRMDAYLAAHPEAVDAVANMIGRQVACECGTVGTCASCALRSAAVGYLKAFGEVVGCTDLDPSRGAKGVSSDLRPGVFEAWISYSHDPDTVPGRLVAVGRSSGNHRVS